MVDWWLGEDPVAVTAQTRTIVPERADRDGSLPVRVTTEDQGQLLLSYPAGTMGYVYGGYCFTGRGYDQRIEVYGSEGGLMYSQQHSYELDVFLPAEALKEYQVVRRGGTTDTPYTASWCPSGCTARCPASPGHGARF